MNTDVLVVWGVPSVQWGSKCKIWGLCWHWMFVGGQQLIRHNSWLSKWTVLRVKRVWFLHSEQYDVCTINSACGHNFCAMFWLYTQWIRRALLMGHRTFGLSLKNISSEETRQFLLISVAGTGQQLLQQCSKVQSTGHAWAPYYWTVPTQQVVAHCSKNNYSKFYCICAKTSRVETAAEREGICLWSCTLGLKF